MLAAVQRIDFRALARAMNAQRDWDVPRSRRSVFGGEIDIDL